MYAHITRLFKSVSDPVPLHIQTTSEIQKNRIHIHIHIHILVNWIQEKVHIQYIYVEFCPTFSKSIPSNPTRSEIRSIDVSSKTKNKKQVHRVIQLTNSSSANITISLFACWFQPAQTSQSTVFFSHNKPASANLNQPRNQPANKPNSHWPPAPACFELERERLSDGQNRGGQARAPLVVLLPVVLLTLSLLSHGHRGSRQESARGTSWQARRATLKRVCKRSWTSPCSPTSCTVASRRSRGKGTSKNCKNNRIS